MKTIFLLSLLFAMLVMVAEGSRKRKAPDGGHEDPKVGTRPPPKRRRVILSGDPQHGHKVKNFLGSPHTSAIILSRTQFAWNCLGNWSPAVRDFVGIFYNFMRNEHLNEEIVLRKLRELEEKSYTAFSILGSKDSIKKNTKRAKLSGELVRNLNVVLPYFRMSVEDLNSGKFYEECEEHLQRMALMKYVNGTFYFSPLTFYRAIQGRAVDIAWRHSPPIRKADTETVCIFEGLPMDVLLIILNLVMIKSPHTFHHVRQVNRWFYNLDPLTSLSQSHFADFDALLKYVGLYVAGEPSAFLRAVHDKSSIFRHKSAEQHAQWRQKSFKYVVRGSEGGFLVMRNNNMSNWRPRSHEALLSGLAKFHDNDKRAANFLIRRLQSLTLRVPDNEVYIFLTMNRVYIDCLVSGCARRFPSMPANLQVALHVFLKAVSIYLVEIIGTVVANTSSFHNVRQYMRDYSVLNLTL